MAFIPLQDMNKAGLKKFWSGTIGLAKRSFAKGVSPEHLVSYQPKFTEASRQCSTATKDLTGVERLQAKAECMKQKLGK